MVLMLFLEKANIMNLKKIIEEIELFDELFYIEYYRDVRVSDELLFDHFVI